MSIIGKEWNASSYSMYIGLGASDGGAPKVIVLLYGKGEVSFVVVTTLRYE